MESSVAATASALPQATCIKSASSAEMLQKANRRAAAEKTVRMIEAEAIAFVVVQTIGFSTGR
jgi:hypothetical protein